MGQGEMGEIRDKVSYSNVVLRASTISLNRRESWGSKIEGNAYESWNKLDPKLPGV